MFEDTVMGKVIIFKFVDVVKTVAYRVEYSLTAMNGTVLYEVASEWAIFKVYVERSVGSWRTTAWWRCRRSSPSRMIWTTGGR